MFWSGQWVLFRTAVIGILIYALLVLFLRISGKRTLSKMNAFDFVITVAIGSTLASVITSRETRLDQGALAILLLVGMQYVITWLSVRSDRFQSLIKAEPALLLFRGKCLKENMKRERVLRTEIEAALREQGISSVEETFAVVLETDGSFSIISRKGATDSAMSGVIGNTKPP
ncbi:MAG: DUF421 domain-containing protein [Syntrophales bacterium]|jgi:uncharacterized membrane protein YcaP (DUF421 family)|nr:DUF421 domain-containing protein [Syntrophales bacterium]